MSQRSKKDIAGLFGAFCESSTVHGTYFWKNADTLVLKILWVIIVLCGIGSAAYIINKSFSAWKQNPVITAVAQIPIEQVPFPSITICPLGNTKFGYVEHVINKKGLDKVEIGRALSELLLLLFLSKKTDFTTADHCLIFICNNPNTSNDANCKDADQFRRYLDQTHHHHNNNNESNINNNHTNNSNNNNSSSSNNNNIYNQILAMFPSEMNVSIPFPQLIKPSTINCEDKVGEFIFLQKITQLMSHFKADTITNPGSLLKMLYLNLKPGKEQDDMFRSYINISRFPELYTSEKEPLPNLVEILTEKESITNDPKRFTSSSNLKYSPELMKAMVLSLHPPHVAATEKENVYPIPNPAFPFCLYQNSQAGGLQYGPYKEHYCNDFQATINEKGLCYTYNNYNLGTDPNMDKNDDMIKIRQVKGCGKTKGLQLVIDSQKMGNQFGDGVDASKGFEVFITVPGVVTHKVPFTIDPSFSGEHHFTIHGIHFIVASEEFVAWNKNAKACYFPKDKELKYFSTYTQDNCLLECRYNKIMARCKCAPWYLNQSKMPICGIAGNGCFHEQFSDYQEELQDRVDCDCRSDCEGIHFFASMNRYPFTDTTTTDANIWWNEKEQKGHLANYLLDPLNIFTDKFTKNLTMLVQNVTSNTELASKRFGNDISILNFYFDTPIITRITLEMRITVFDQIAAIGGSLGLFTGISLITFLEIFYWVVKLAVAGLRKMGSKNVVVRPNVNYVVSEERMPNDEFVSGGVRSHYSKEY